MIIGPLSCKKLIEPKVYSSLTDVNAFLTKSDAIAAVNATYARLKQPSGRGDSWMYYAGFQQLLTDMTTDAAIAMGGDHGKLADGTWGANNVYVSYGWQFPYKLVSDAINGIYYINKMETNPYILRYLKLRKTTFKPMAIIKY